MLVWSLKKLLQIFGEREEEGLRKLEKEERESNGKEEKEEQKKKKQKKSGMVKVGEMTFFYGPKATKIVHIAIKIILFEQKILVIY